MKTLAAILALVLVALALAAADSVAAQKPRPTQSPTTSMGALGSSITREGNSVASTNIRMIRSPLPNIVANAEYMSLGPSGPLVPDTTTGFTGFRVEGGVFHRLRVTLGSSERETWLLIDDIVTGRADSRGVSVSYMYSPSDPSTRDLWSAMAGAPRVLGSEPEAPPIRWVSPTSFEWIMRADTLAFEQKA
jgi:hypothetical protein